MYDCMCMGKGLAVMYVYGPSVCGVLGVSQESHHLEGGELLGRYLTLHPKPLCVPLSTGR